tara:strand:+ start:17 stop:514 length:498 start_codon:yes stop_codon:yes gene_type:complete
MKSIILFRHAKSDWNATYSSDHQRPINHRGIKASKLMGSYLAKINEIPDLIISSSALRALQTMENAISAGKWESKITVKKEVYHASVSTLIDLIKRTKNIYSNICIIGHEPTFSYFLKSITDESVFKFPTATMAKIILKVESWNNLDDKSSKLLWIRKPKELSNK